MSATNDEPVSSEVTRRHFLEKAATTGALAATGVLFGGGGSALARTAARRTAVTAAASNTVRFLSWDTIAVMQPVVDLFKKKHPKIDLVLEFETPSSYVSTLATRIASGTAPDVFIYTSQNKGPLNAGNHVLDLSDQPLARVMAKVNKTFMSNNGKVYGFSPASWAAGPIWNMDLLDKANVKPPTTWAQFIDVCKALKASGVTPYADASQVGAALEGLLGSYFLHHGLFKVGQVQAKADRMIFGGKSTFKRQWAAPLNAYYELYSSGLVPTSTTALTGAQLDSEMATGALAGLGSGPWDVAAILQENPKLNLKMYPTPGLQAGQEFWCGSPNEGWAVYSKTKSQQAALTFVNFLATPDALRAYAKSSGDIITTSNYKSPVSSALKLTEQAVRSSDYYFTGNSWPVNDSQAMGNVAVAQLNAMVGGQATPTAVLAAMDQEAAKLRK